MDVAILIMLILWYLWHFLEPKLDWNYETGERILWYSDPFNYGYRKSIILYIDRTKIKNQ